MVYVDLGFLFTMQTIQDADSLWMLFHFTNNHLKKTPKKIPQKVYIFRPRKELGTQKLLWDKSSFFVLRIRSSFFGPFLRNAKKLLLLVVEEEVVEEEVTLVVVTFCQRGKKKTTVGCFQK